MSLASLAADEIGLSPNHNEVVMFSVIFFPTEEKMAFSTSTETLTPG